MRVLRVLLAVWVLGLVSCCLGQAPRPNLLVAIADDWSWPHAGAYGCTWVKTPAFDRVARQGVLFRNAYTPNAKCAPSRACILTGRNSWQLEEAANHVPFFPAKFRSYAEAMGEHGYYVGFTGKGWAPGVAKAADGRNRELTGKAFNRRTAPPPARGISPNDYAANFADFLRERPARKPFCFWYGGTEPHRDYEPGVGSAKGGKKPDDIGRVPAFWPDNPTVRSDLLDYAFEVEHFDRHLERMLNVLETSGELSNTVVLVTSDNGMPFPRVKGNAYEYATHLPLAILWLGGVRHPGRQIEDYVSFIDFAPTFMELAGLDSARAGMAPMQGRSLGNLLRSDRSGRIEPARDHLLLGQERHDIGRPHDWGYPIRGIVKRGFLYLHNFEPSRWPACNPETGYLNCDGSPTKTWCIQSRQKPGTLPYWQLSFGLRPAEELYHVTVDPDCLTNLVAQPKFADLKQELRNQLWEELKQQNDPRILGNGAVFDAYPYAEARMRNFHARFTNGERLNPGWINPDDFDPLTPEEEQYYRELWRDQRPR